MKQPVAIAGGGLAGLAAAVRLADSEHWRPILIETRKRLGGRATSLTDPRTGRVIDNCQHVLMGCCSSLIDLLDRLGTLDDVTWHRRLFWTAGGDVIDRLQPGWLPAPLHYTTALLRMRLYTFSEKQTIARAMWRLLRLGIAGRLQWRQRTFAEFLAGTEQPDGLVQRFWNPIVVSACNLDVTRVGAEYAMQVFQEAFLAGAWPATMGVPAVPLAALYDPARRRIEDGGGQVHLGTSVRSMAYDGSRVTGVVTADGMIESAAVIAAVPPDRLERLTSETMHRADARLQSLDQIDWSPILGVHLTFDQPVMDLPHLTIIDHDVQWLFDKGTDREGRQHLHAVISAADDWMDLDEAAIARRVMRDVHAVLPRTVGLEPIDVRSIKEKHATFAAVPGLESRRPSTSPGAIGVHGGGIPNLYLAGDWCDTGWPATMEGAVRSGYAAAGAIMDTDCSVPDVPAGFFARVLGLR